MKTNWEVYSFEQLGTERLYEILRLRQEVFAVEQNCAYQDCDMKDQKALHLCGYRDSELLALARILPPDYSYKGYTSLGRICTRLAARRSGLGRELMQQALAQLGQRYPEWPVRIAAQTYLLPFYSSFGFVATDLAYYEDGIHHTEMVLAKV